MESCKLDAYKMFFSVANVCKEDNNNNFIVAVSHDGYTSVSASYKGIEGLNLLAGLVQTFKKDMLESGLSKEEFKILLLSMVDYSEEDEE